MTPCSALLAHDLASGRGAHHRNPPGNLSPRLAGLRGVVDGALAHVGQVACDGRKVLAVVEDHQVVLAAVAQIIKSTADNARWAPSRSRRYCADSIHRHAPFGSTASGTARRTFPTSARTRRRCGPSGGTRRAEDDRTRPSRRRRPLPRPPAARGPAGSAAGRRTPQCEVDRFLLRLRPGQPHRLGEGIIVDVDLCQCHHLPRIVDDV